MTMTQATASHTPPDYAPAIRELREAADRNRQNTAFAELARGEVVYILDANVAVHYIQEGRAGHGQLSFGNLLMRGKSAQAIARTSDRMTLEYLLSGKLPGQSGRPVYLTPPHWNETLGKAGRIARDVGRLPEKYEGQLRRLAAEPDLARRLARAEEELPRDIVEALKTGPAVDRRLRAAFAGKTPKLRPLDTEPELWPRALDRIRLADVRAWRTALAMQREKARAARPREAKAAGSGADERGSQNLDHDAEALAIIQALYRENPEACGEEGTRRLLLITADNSILSAVEARKAELAEERIPVFVQHPRVFSPILNHLAMSQLTASQRALERVPLDEMGKVFVAVQTALDRYWEGGPRARRIPAQAVSIGNVRRQWSAAARLLIAAHAAFFREDSEAAAEAARLLAEPGKLLALRDSLIETVEQIGREHGKLGVEAALRRLPEAVGAARRSGAAEQRAPLQVVGVDLLAVLRDGGSGREPGPLGARLEVPRAAERSPTAGLYALLDAIADGPEGEALAKAIAERLGERLAEAPSATATATQAHLLMSCIFLAVGAWESGRECARRARDASARKDPLWREANYCIALANRFLLRSQRDFAEADKVLDNNLEEQNADRSVEGQLAGIRDWVELAALRMTACLLDAIDDVKPFRQVVRDLGSDLRLLPEREHSDTFGRAADRMVEQRERLDNDFSGPPANAGVERMLGRLRRQLFTNLAGIDVFRSALAPRLGAAAPEGLAAALDRLRQDFEPAQRSRMARVYLAVGEFLLQPDPAIHAAALDCLAKEMDGAALTDVDRIEFCFLRDYLLSRDAGLGTPADERPHPPAEDHVVIV
jgi:hypothetical protein